MKTQGITDLTLRERYTIEIMLEEKKTIKEISIKLNRHYNTIYREIKRGTVELLSSELKPYKKYCADVGLRIYRENQKEKGRPLKIDNDLKLIRYIESKIKNENWSPDAIIGYIKTHNIRFKTNICTKTVYNYIDNGVFLNVVNRDLPTKREKRNYHKTKKISFRNLKGLSIETRPNYIDDREEFGHWEMDTVVSGHKNDGKASLLVFTERKTRIELVFKMKNRTQKETIRIINQIEKRYTEKGFREIFKTITVDNGTEFLNWQELEKSIRNKRPRTKIYFCHPFASCERGSNENQNKLVRRWIKKGSDIGQYSDQYVKEVQSNINNYPRKMFNYQSSNEILELEKLNYAI